MIDLLGALGETIINLLIGILILVLEFILIIVAFLLDLIINTFAFLLDGDFMSKVYSALPVLSQADDILTTAGVGIAVILLAVMIYHMILAPLISGGKNAVYPSMVVFRTLIVIPLVMCAESISVWLSRLFASFYSVMAGAFSTQLSPYQSGGNPFYLSSAMASFFGQQLSDFSNAPTTAIQTISDSTGFPEGVMDTLSSALGILLVLILVILVGWNLIQFFLELFERFAVMFLIMKISPLTLATAIYPSSENIAKSWLRFFIGQFTLWVLQAMCMGWCVGCLASPNMFASAFSGSTATTALLAWAGISYGLINMSRHVDDYINKLGLTAAVTGSDFFGDLTGMARAIGVGKDAAKAVGGAAHSAGDAFGKAGNAVSQGASVLGDKIPDDAVKNAFTKAGEAITQHGPLSTAAGLAAASTAAMAGAPLLPIVGAGLATKAGVQAAANMAKQHSQDNLNSKLAVSAPMRDAPSGTTAKQDFKTKDTDNRNVKDFENSATFTRPDGVVAAEQTVNGKVDISNPDQPNFTTDAVSRDYQLGAVNDDTAKFSLDGKDYQTVYDGSEAKTYSFDKNGNMNSAPVVTQRQNFKHGAADAAYSASQQLSAKKQRETFEAGGGNFRGGGAGKRDFHAGGGDTRGGGTGRNK